MNPRHPLVLGGLVVWSACQGSVLDPELPGLETDGADAIPSPSTLDERIGPCTADATSPTHLLVTTTDFATGSLAVVDLAALTLETDVAVGSPDAIPFGHRGRPFLLHRFGLDYLEVLEPGTWRSLAQHPIDVPNATSSNPHGLAITDEDIAYVPLFGTPKLAVLDLSAAPERSVIDLVSIGDFADDDGNPEANLALLCGGVVWVSLQRLDPSFQRTAPDALIAFDTSNNRPIDLDPEAEGVQGIELQGEWLRQLRVDPQDPEGTTVLALTTGIERIDLATAEVSWAVPAEAFAAAGIDAADLPQSFDVADDGTVAYVAAYEAGFGQVRLFRVGLDGAEPSIPEVVAEGFDSVERTLEVVGDRVWYASTRLGAPGVWAFDARTTPLEAVVGPLDTGLPPYSVTTLGAAR